MGPNTNEARDEATGLGEQRMADEGGPAESSPQGDGDSGAGAEPGSSPVGDQPAGEKKSDE